MVENIKTEQDAYTAIMKYMIANGSAPHFTKLARMLDVTFDKARELQRIASKRGVGCWLAHDMDTVESWAPFSNIPTNYLVSIDGVEKWYGQ